MMRYLALILLLLSVEVKAAGFLEGFEDFPVMSGLEQTKGEVLSFGNEESRLVEAYLGSSSLRFSDVESFYKSTLPQMGWKYLGSKRGVLSFAREGEKIEISLLENKPLLVLISLKGRY